MRMIFWGTGNTARERLAQIKRFSQKIEIVAFVDGCRDQIEKGLLWEGYKLAAPQEISRLNIDYICILSIWEWEIRKRIYSEELFDLSKIISFHEICMMDSFEMSIDDCYGRLLECVPLWQIECMEMWRSYEYLKRNYSYILCDTRFRVTDRNKKVHFQENITPVWVLWLQGFAQAPDLVKICIHSLKRILKKEENICLLDKNNLFNYIDLPDYIVQKWEKGIISNAHFADLVRVCLLNVYGGVWIDATVYFTGDQLPEYIKKSRLFMFRTTRNGKISTEPRVAANWLISAQRQNKMLIILEELLKEYWKKENRTINYYFFHIFWTMVTECFPDEWETQVETVLKDPAQLLNEELFHEFNDVRFNHLKQISDIHKLSYKRPYTESGKNSFWAKIYESEKENGWICH